MAVRIVIQRWPATISAGTTDHWVTKAWPPPSSRTKTNALIMMMRIVTTGMRAGRRVAPRSGSGLPCRHPTLWGNSQSPKLRPSYERGRFRRERNAGRHGSMKQSERAVILFLPSHTAGSVARLNRFSGQKRLRSILGDGKRRSRLQIGVEFPEYRGIVAEVLL